MAVKPDPKRPGTYYASFGKRHPITRQVICLRRTGFKSMAKAREAERELVLEIEAKIRRTLTPTWERVLEEFLSASRLKGFSAKTVYAYETCLRAHTLDRWAGRYVDEISSSDIRDVILSKLKDRAPAHQDYFLRCVRSVFRFALESNYISRNPTPQMKFKFGEKIQAVLTRDQATYLLEKAKELGWHWYPHYAMALYTGLRNGELFALTWEKVDLENRTILVNCSWNSYDGLKSTKSGDDRIVEIAPPLIPILRELRAKGIDNHVLPRNSRWEAGVQARELGVFLRSIGLPQIRFHDLRATWATTLLSQGVEPIKVMKMGGWKDLETMMIYARKAGVDIRGATDGLTFCNIGGKVLKLTEAL